MESARSSATITPVIKTIKIPSARPHPIVVGSTEAKPREHPTTVQVRYFASARNAAGRKSEILTLPAKASIDTAVTIMRQRHADALQPILDQATFLMNGVRVADRTMRVADGAELDVLPPFTGCG